MSRFFALILSVAISFSTMSADSCDWSTIKQEGDKFVYSAQCHIQVGKLIKENEMRQEQVAKLNSAIELKDLAIDKAEERTKLWRDTSYDLENRLQAQRKWSAYNDWIYLGGGIGLTLLSAWAIKQVGR